MTDRTVSIIIPCFNDGEYLEETIASVREQTWQDTECIIVDDGSTDEKTIHILNGLKEEGYTVLSGNHRGPAAARNIGITASGGRYILPLDADDLIEPTYVEKAFSYLEAHPEKKVVYCQADFFGAKSGRWKESDFSMKRYMLSNCIFVSALFRKEDWERAGGYCESFTAGLEDYDFWMSLVQEEDDVYQIPEVLFHYRIKPDSRSAQLISNHEQLLYTNQLLFERHQELYLKHAGEIIPELRTLLREHSVHLEGLLTDPIVKYWLSVKELKPRRARRWLRLYQQKNRIGQMLRRK